jgi:hypothetical protein
MVDECQELVNTGAYRTSLAQILRTLTGLRKITAQPVLAPGEHIPGWDGAVQVLDITGFGKYDLSIVFYGDWFYDTKHKMVTQYEDEYGMEACRVEDPGPQARFYEDFLAAVEEKRVVDGEVEVVLVWRDVVVVL